MKKIGILVLCLVFIPNLVFGRSPTSSDCYTATGFGRTQSNGSYTYSSDHNSVPAFTNGTDYVFVDASNFPSYYWIVKSTLADTNGGYYFLEVGTQDPSQGSWGVGAFSSPAGSFALVSCGGGGGGVATTTATSTFPYSVNDLNFIWGVSLFIALISLWRLMFSPFNKGKIQL